jgi:hypothetical protein
MVWCAMSKSSRQPGARVDVSDTETQRQIDDTQRQIDELREVLLARRRVRDAARQRLDLLEEQAARMGIDTPPHVTNEIVGLTGKLKDRDSEIFEIEKKLTLLERGPPPPIAFIVPDQEPHIPVLAPALVEARLTTIQRLLEQGIETLGEISAVRTLLADLLRDLRALLDQNKQLSSDVAALTKRDTDKDKNDAEWREVERTERHQGQEDRRQRDGLLIFVLFVIAVAVVLIAIRVY